MRKGLNSLRGGFTLLEMVIAVSLLGVMILAVGLTSRRATEAFDEGSSVDALNARAHRVLDRILTPLEAANSTGLGPQPEIQFGFERLDYRLATDWVGGAPVWGPDCSIHLELEPGEIDDGADNDGDGLVDEGQVIWVESPGLAAERRLVLCRGVRELLEGEQPNGLDDNGNGLIDEPGLCFQRQGDVLTLRMTLDALDPQGRPLTRTVESSVWVRN